MSGNIAISSYYVLKTHTQFTPSAEKKIFFLFGPRATGKTSLIARQFKEWEAHLCPLTREEIPDFSLERYLQFGGLPMVYLSLNWVFSTCLD